MKTVRDACVLKEGALEVRVSDEIAQLDEVLKDPAFAGEFFGKTHVTEGLRTLLKEGLARLSGKSSQAVFHLKQSMGGGKTHLMTALGLVARHVHVRDRFFEGYSDAYRFGEAKVAAFNGRIRPNGYFWGEIAKQLGNAEAFAGFNATNDAPDEAAWLNLFDGIGPILILLDEMPPYFNYYAARESANGSMANMITYGLATMLTAAQKRTNVCVVIADLHASYEEGGKLINKALDDVRQEVGRQERNITPVDLAGNEIYEILRKKLFASLPGRAVIENIAQSYGRSLSEATKSKTVGRSAEAIAEDVVLTYPFHPRLKNLIALFKENEKFRQTRGLMEFVSRLLKSVWTRQDNDVYLIGTQHFDFALPDVRDAFERIGMLRDIVSRDLWDENSNAHAQLIDINAGNDCAKQVGSVILSASMSTAVNAVKGLSREELLEYVLSPHMEASDFIQALETLHAQAWHMHISTDDRYYFDPQENLGRMLQSYAQDAPEGQIEQLKRDRLSELFRVQSGTAYQKVLPLPEIDEIKDEIRRSRVLVIVEPDAKLPPERIAAFFADLPQKNNLCVLTGDRAEMTRLDTAARHIFAVKKAERRIDARHPQFGELQKRKEESEQTFFSTVQALFDKVLRPVIRQGQVELRAEALETSRDQKEPFSGEKQIERTLASEKVGKLILNVESEESFNTIRAKAEAMLWPAGEDRARWADIVDRASQNAGFFWLPPKGLETIKRLCVEKGRWEDTGDGWINKSPAKKKTSVQVNVIGDMNDDGKVRLQVTPIHAGPAPQIFVSETLPVTESSKRLTEQSFETSALRLHFLVVDPTGQFEKGDPKTWSNRLEIKVVSEDVRDGSRLIELKALPQGQVRFTTDGSEPRYGKIAEGPIDIGMGSVKLLAFAEADGLDTKESFSFSALASPSAGQGADEWEEEVEVDPLSSLVMDKPASLKRKLTFDDRASTWKAISAAKVNRARFTAPRVTLGDGDQAVSVTFGSGASIEAEALGRMLETMQESFDANAPLTLNTRQLQFAAGHDLGAFVGTMAVSIKQEDIDQ